MTTRLPIIVALAALVLLASTVTTSASTISINFSAFGADDASVDSGETAIVGTDAIDTAILGADSVDGSGWNNILLGTTAGAPTTFTAATQGGLHIDLIDDTGFDSGADLTSINGSPGGNFFANTSTATDNATNRAAQGEGGLMESFLLLGGGESVTVSGLPGSLTASGYTAYVFFDIGVVTRTYGLEANGSTIYWTADTFGTDSDADENGLIDWLQATATMDGNYAVFTGLTSSTFTIMGDATVGGRSALAGIQFVANIPEPSTAVIWSVLGALGLGFGRRRRRAPNSASLRCKIAG